MTCITMELQDTNGCVIDWNDTLYKEQSRLLVHIFGIRSHAGFQIFLRRTNGDIIPSKDFVETASYVRENSVVIDFKVIDILSSRNKQFPFFNICLMSNTVEVQSQQFRIKSKKTESIKDKTPVKQNVISNVLEILKGLVNQDNCMSCSKKNGNHHERCKLATTTQEFEAYFKSKSTKNKRTEDATDAGKSKKMKTCVPVHTMNSSQTTHVSKLPFDAMNSSQTTCDTSVPESVYDLRFLFGDDQCNNPKLSEYEHEEIQRHDSLSDFTKETSFNDNTLSF